MLREIKWSDVFEINQTGEINWSERVNQLLARSGLTTGNHKHTGRRRIAAGAAALLIEPPKATNELDKLVEVRQNAAAAKIRYANLIALSDYQAAAREIEGWLLDPEHPERWRHLYYDESGASDYLRKKLPAPSNERQDATADTLRDLVAYWPSRLARDEDPHRLGVFRSAIANRMFPDSAPPYVGRSIDRILDDVLHRLPLALIVGPAIAGKTRTAYEAIGRCFPDASVIVPRRADTLRGIVEALERHSADGSVRVLWLNGIEHYLANSHLDWRDVERWQAISPRVVAIATTTARVQSLLMRDDRGARLLFDQIRGMGGELWLDAHLRGDETSVLERLYPKTARHLGRYLVSADELMDKLSEGADTCPEGVALVQVALDVVRTRILYTPSVSLCACWPYYLRRLAPYLVPSEALFWQALKWACRPVQSGAALLRMDHDGGIEVSGFVVERVDEKLSLVADMTDLLQATFGRSDDFDLWGGGFKSGEWIHHDSWKTVAPGLWAWDWQLLLMTQAMDEYRDFLKDWITVIDDGISKTYKLGPKFIEARYRLASGNF
jgi:hypothetical protein